MQSSTQDPSTDGGLGETLSRRQRRTKEFLGEIRARTDAAKQSLLAQIERILETLEGEKAECRKTREELLTKSEDLHRQMEIVGRFRDDFAKWQDQREAACQKALEQQTAISDRIEKQQAVLDGKLAELKKFQAELDQREEELRKLQRETSLAQQDFDVQKQYLEEKQKRLNERLAEVEVDREELAVLRKKTAAQRRKLAAAVQAKRAAGPPPAVAVSEPRIVETAGADKEAIREIESRKREIEEELERAKRELSRQSEELDEVVREKIELIQRLDEAERKSAEITEGGSPLEEGEEAETLSEEIEQLQLQNRNLQEELESLRSRMSESATTQGAASVVAAATAGGALDWEAQKAQILASLESEGTDVPPEREVERTEIRKVVQRTDAVVAEKNREIEELTALLQEKTENVSGSMAIGAAAVGDILDNDEVIAQERARLEELKKEWEEKLRQAEVEVSLERASIARERAVLTEALEKNPVQQTGEHVDTGKGAESSRKKWMSALGLSDEDNEPQD